MKEEDEIEDGGMEDRGVMGGRIEGQKMEE